MSTITHHGAVKIEGTYRKTRQGTWVALIDYAEIIALRDRVGNQNAFPGEVIIRKASGELESRAVAKVGAAFTTSEGPRCYLYLKPKTRGRLSDEWSDGFTTAERDMMSGRG